MCIYIYIYIRTYIYTHTIYIYRERETYVYTYIYIYIYTYILLVLVQGLHQAGRCLPRGRRDPGKGVLLLCMVFVVALICYYY